MYCRMFSTGLSSGDFGGRARIVMLAGMSNLVQMPSGLIDEEGGVGLPV
jgi:hypothetical protein